jgi:recombination protein RecA
MASKIVKDVKKKYGGNILMKAKDFGVQKVPRISTGVFLLDVALGGGLPAGKVGIFWGHKSTGKTALCLRTLGNMQRSCAACFRPAEPGAKSAKDCECGEFREPICVYMDIEGSWDHSWAALMGVNEERIILSVPEFAEQTLDITEAHLRSGEVDLVIVDSIAFLTPSKEIEESTSKALQAEQARVVGRAIRKFNSALNYCDLKWQRRPTILFTNQIRMKLGVMYGNPETTPGGFSPGFAATTEVHTFGGKYEMDEVTGRPLWVDMKFRVEKNKSSGAKMEGEWRMMLTDTETKKKGDVADEQELVSVGARIGLVTGEGQKWECLGEKYIAKSKVTERLVSDLEFKGRFQDAVMKLLLAA